MYYLLGNVTFGEEDSFLEVFFFFLELCERRKSIQRQDNGNSGNSSVTTTGTSGRGLGHNEVYLVTDDARLIHSVIGLTCLPN